MFFLIIIPGLPTNFKVRFVPSPIHDPIGRVDSGILTLSRWNSPIAYRYQLPGDFPWPTRIFHLKRCLSVLRIKSAVDNKNWVLINLHLSAYDADGKLRVQQFDFVKDLMLKHYNEGHYVVIGGDWNSLFPNITMDSFGIFNTPEESLFWIQNIRKKPDTRKMALDIR